MRIFQKFYDKFIRGEDFSDGMGMTSFVGIIVTLLMSLITNSCFGDTGNLTAWNWFFLLSSVVFSILLFLTIQGCFDFRERMGIGNYQLTYIQFFDIKKRYEWLIFPVSLKKTAKPMKLFCPYINDEVSNVLIYEIRSKLIELYNKADFSKETKELYKMAIPQIKKLYESLSSSIKNMQSSDTYISEKAINEFLDNKDSILEYIANIQKPIDKIVDYNQYVERAKSDITDTFMDIRMVNNLEKSEAEVLSDKYEKILQESR